MTNAGLNLVDMDNFRLFGFQHKNALRVHLVRYGKSPTMTTTPLEANFCGPFDRDDYAAAGRETTVCPAASRRATR
jgi:hypothetical protein